MARKRVVVEVEDHPEELEGIEIDFRGGVFAIRGYMPGLLLLKFASVATAEEDSGSATSIAMLELLEYMVDDWEGFQAHITAPDTYATQEDLAAIFSTIVESVSDRPTEMPSSSEVGQITTAVKSTADKLAVGLGN